MNRILQDIRLGRFLGTIVFALLMGWFTECKKEEEPEKVLEKGTMTDRQGNVYNTVKIGSQWWMVENLKVKVYNDSSAITEVKSTEPDSNWENSTKGAFCELDKRYGLHYNWLAITSSKKLAPAGWHIPSDEEWKTLETELGMIKDEVEKTAWRGDKESEKLIPEYSVGWPSFPLVYGNNESGFTALPGGCRVFNGTEGEVTYTGFWWTSTASNSMDAWYRNVSSNNFKIFRYYANKKYGMSVRCVKD